MTSRLERQPDRLPTLRKADDLLRWAADMVAGLNNYLATIERFMPGGRYTVVSPREVRIGALPAPGGVDRLLILVEDDGATRTLIFSDGTAWQRLSTGTNPAS